jgi:hypothetical protein
MNGTAGDGARGRGGGLNGVRWCLHAYIRQCSTSRSTGGRSHLPAGVAALARRLAPDGSRGAASATDFQRAEMDYHFSLVNTLLRFCSLKA